MKYISPEHRDFIELMQRYNALSELMPSEAEILESADARSTAQLLLAELQSIQRKMDGRVVAAKGG